MTNTADTNKTESAAARLETKKSYYYGWLDKIYQYNVRPGSRVLHIGCDCGDLLAAVKPSYGVGIDSNPKAIEVAQKRYPHLHFYTRQPHETQLDETFDYVLICNSIGNWPDIQQVFEHLRPLTHEDTRIVITYYSYLWEGRFAARVGMRTAADPTVTRTGCRRKISPICWT